MAIAMIDAAEAGKTWNGRKLLPGGTVVEASAGNCAPAVAMVCAARGYHSKVFLYRYNFQNGTDARLKITQAYGTNVSISTDPAVYMGEAAFKEFEKIDKDMPHVMAAKVDCEKVEENDSRAVWVDQIYNDYNYVGQKQMGYEIYDQLDGKIDAIGCSVGSGATLYGLSLALKEKNVRPEIIFGIVPEGCEEYIDFAGTESNYGEFYVPDSNHKLAKALGLKKWITEKSIAEKLIEAGYPDKFFLVTEEEARAMANRLCREEGIYCGMSSGANVAIALKVAKRLGKGKNVVTTIVDRRDRYLSEYPNDKYVV